MFELEKLGEKTYYLKNVTNIGIYLEDDNNIWIIDTGNDQEAGKKILKTITANNWTVKGIINTHSHADHIGGNKVIVDRTNCQVLAHNTERCLTEFPYLEPISLYGSSPYKELKNKILMAKPTNKVLEIENNLPKGLELLELKGHSCDMIGIKTSDDVIFIGDAISSEKTIEKYNLIFNFDIKETLNTIDYLKTLNAKYFIASHVEKKEDITKLCDVNKNKIIEISNKILDYCKEKRTLENIVKYIFDTYNLMINNNQYLLNSSIIKSHLTYLKEQEKIEIIFEDNYQYFKAI